MYKLAFIIVLIMSITPAGAQPKTDTLLKKILERSGPELISRVLEHVNTYRLQIIYTQINRTRKNQPLFKNYFYNYDPSMYYNPASTVKMPLAFLALEKLNKMRIKGVNKYTFIQFDSSYEKQT